MSEGNATAATDRRAGEALRFNPFQSLRVSYGMLLGEDDFQILMGNPRGKLMLHSAWLHGSGVVRGYALDRDDEGRLRIGPGLAIDGLGRELILEAPHCIDVDAWWADEQKKGVAPDTTEGAKQGQQKTPSGSGPPSVACLVAVFDTCLDRPVPALADPCDLERTPAECSRVVETVRLELRAGDCPPAPASGPYHRVRVLLGLDEAGTDDPAGAEAVKARKEVLAASPADRPRVLLGVFRRLAAGDVTDLQPPAGKDKDKDCPPVFPVPEDRAAVPLAKITFRPDTEDCLRRGSWDWDHTVRRALIATSTIQELACGLAPGLLAGVVDPDVGGPRVVHRSVTWEDPTTLRFEVTLPLLRGSLSRNPIAVSSLGEAGWVREDLEDAPHYDGQRTVRVQLHEPPTHEKVRLLVRGTGPTPVTGTTGIPLAGRDDGPAVPEDEGRDAVIRIERRAP